MNYIACKPQNSLISYIYNIVGENSKNSYMYQTNILDENQNPIIGTIIKYNNSLTGISCGTNIFEEKCYFIAVSFSNGDYYNGEILNGQFHGKGYYIYANGDIYIGDFICGALHGVGEFIFDKDNYYIGDFYCGLAHGCGKIVLDNGNMINGTFIYGMFDSFRN